MITPVETSAFVMGAGAIGWCLGATFYAFRRFVWKAIN